MKPYIKSVSFKLGKNNISADELKEILSKKKYKIDIENTKAK